MSVLRSKRLKPLVWIGAILCAAILVGFIANVRLLNEEVDKLSQQYLDNRPWHLSQLQSEIERLRYELRSLQLDPSEEQQQNTSIMIELVWNRADIILSGDLTKVAQEADISVLPFLEEIVTTFNQYEPKLYQLSEEDVLQLLITTTQWSQLYREQVNAIFKLSYQNYELMSQGVIDAYEGLRLQLISFVLVLSILLGLLTTLAVQSQVLSLRAYRANKAKSEFLANMTHELRTPLNGIIGTIQLMQGQEKIEQDWLKTLDASSESLLAQINDVLDFSRIESGQLLLENTDFDIGLMLQQIESVMTPLAKRKKINLVIESDPDLYPSFWVHGDRIKLRQILLNLVSNAIKFTEKGEVNLSVHRVAESDFKWQVSDTGIGIPEERLEAIFQPFQQAENDTNRRYGGSGLGLTICRKLADLMNGTLSAQSEKDVGSEFVLLTPLKPTLSPKEVHQQGSSQDQPTPETPTGRVLLIEDNVVNQKVASAMLRKIGFDVDVAFDGEQGVQLSTEKAYLCILMDIQMPVMDGFECTQNIRAAGVVTPIIALTANSSEDIRSQALTAGMDDFISKPFRIEHLEQVITRNANP